MFHHREGCCAAYAAARRRRCRRQRQRRADAVCEVRGVRGLLGADGEVVVVRMLVDAERAPRVERAGTMNRQEGEEYAGVGEGAHVAELQNVRKMEI
jgi:hypothetical protein